MHNKKPKTYGAAKVRTMGRSILPSTRAKGARDDKRNVKKRERQRVRTALHDVTDIESALDSDRDWDHTEDVRIREVMWDRRNGDKLGHFLHWAERITTHLDDEQDKYWYVAGLMPDTLPGRHALTHLPWDKYHDRFSYRYRWLNRSQDYTHRRAQHYCAMHAALYKVIEAGCLTPFNRTIKRVWQTPYSTAPHYRTFWRQHESKSEFYRCEQCNKPRLLLGVHDIDGFLGHDYGLHRDAAEKIQQWLVEHEFLRP